jgi:four helix bundle protein
VRFGDASRRRHHGRAGPERGEADSQGDQVRRQKTEDGRQKKEGTMGVAAERFEDLEVWRKGHRLVLQVYRMTTSFPKSELFGLVTQMRRAAVSVPANIAEGFKRRGKPDKVRVMNIAQSSLEELRYYFILATDLGYADTKAERGAADEVARMLHVYVTNIAASRS